MYINHLPWVRFFPSFFFCKKVLPTSQITNHEHSWSMNEQPSAAFRAARAILDWAVLIVMLVIPGLIQSYAVVYAIAFGLGVLVMGINGYRHKTGSIKVFPKIFEVGVVVINLALLIFELLVSPSRDWSKNWTSVLINGSLLVLVLFSIAIKKPFTLQFAMEKVPEAYWGTDTFVWINLVISWAWAANFALSLAFSLGYIYLYPHSDVLRIIPGLVILFITLQFTARFPSYMKTRRTIDPSRLRSLTTTSGTNDTPEGVSTMSPLISGDTSGAYA